VTALRILFLSDNFPPEVNAPASRTHEHCREWVRMGHEVTVVTCAPNFPAGKVYAGYRNRPWSSETMDGIRVVRVWSYITANEGNFRRTLDYVSFMWSATLAGLFLRRHDVLVATSPQFFTACAGYAVSRLRRVPFVFELRDLWPESIKAVGAMRDSFALRWLERLELFLYRKAAAIVTVTHSFRDRLDERGIDVGKVDVVTNGVDLSRFVPRGRDEELAARLGLAGKFVAGYIGTHGLAHGLETVLDAAEMLASQPDGDRYRVVLLGDGARKRHLLEHAARRKLANVVFLDSVPKSEVSRYWSLLDVSIIHLIDDPLFRTVIPSKLFESMGMGVPIAHGVGGESAEIVEQYGVGRVFRSGDAAALASVLQDMAREPAVLAEYRRACARAAPEFDRVQLARRMGSFLESLAARER
jgi:glycosyltransferase involved in cell wall biosynthesis